MRQPDFHVVSARGDDLVPRTRPNLLLFHRGSQADKLAVGSLLERLARLAPITNEIKHELVVPALSVGKKNNGF